MRTRAQVHQQPNVAAKRSFENINKNDNQQQPSKRKRVAFTDITNALNGVVLDSGKKNQKLELNRQQSLSLSEPPSPDESQECCLQSASQNSSSSSSGESERNSSQQSVCEQKIPSQPPSDQESSQSDNKKSDETLDLPEYDRSQISDPFQIPHYAEFIFQYYRRREKAFPVLDYFAAGLQPDITRHMRAVLVDWMVEVQESFELNHETLYLAVKLTDLYLGRVRIPKEQLQLVGSCSLFIAAKFDERVPPCSDDFIYICDDAYTRDDLLAMEREILIRLDFDLGIPISYRFTRRIAKATQENMEMLTLARYILETSLMHYQFALELDSKLAAASLLLAIRMKNPQSWSWSSLHVLHSGYSLQQLEPLMWRLNTMIKSPPPSKTTNTIHTKYSHKVFFEVAQTDPLPDQ